MVIPVGLPDAQQLVVADKDLNGRVGTKEIMRVMFSLLEDPTSPRSDLLDQSSPTFPDHSHFGRGLFAPH